MKQRSLRSNEPPLSGEWWVEWVGPKLNRCGNMIPVSGLSRVLAQHNPGYASVYWFSEADAREIRASGHSRGLSSYAVAADRVWIDIDTGDGGMRKATKILDEHGGGYEVWSSGGKGYHIAIPHELIYDKRLPYSHKVFVESLGIDCDLSLYQHSRVLSLSGRIHPITGKRKQFVERVDGMQPQIKLVDPPKIDIQVDEADITPAFALHQMTKLAEREPTPGNRHTRIWSVAMSCAKAGLSFSATLGMVQEIVSRWLNPKEPEEVERAVAQAYRRTQSGT